MSRQKDNNRRRRFRVQLPPDLMLRATLNGIDYDVIEIAELSLVVTAKYVVNVDGACYGTIQWSDGRVAKISGEIDRLSHTGRVINQIQGITSPDVLKEQRRLLRTFPAVRDLSRSIWDFRPQIFRPEID